MKTAIIETSEGVWEGIAQVIRAAGYETMAQIVEAGGEDAEANVLYFLRLYKQRMYGTFHSINEDGEIDREGKINPEMRALYDRTEALIRKALHTEEAA